MTRKEALAELIEKVESGKTAKVRVWYWAVGSRYSVASKAAAGYLDAAKALHEAVLPGWWWKVIHPDPSYVQVGMPGIGVYAAQSEDPARAWLLAILRALYAQETDT